MNDMRTYVHQGGCVTHILNVNLSPAGPDQVDHDGMIYDQIYLAIFQKIHDKKIIKTKNGIDITITWLSIDNTHTKYYTDVKGLIGDIGVKRHTTELFYEILETLDEQYKGISVKLDFDVTIPLSCNSAYLPRVFGRGG